MSNLKASRARRGMLCSFPKCGVAIEYDKENTELNICSKCNIKFESELNKAKHYVYTLKNIKYDKYSRLTIKAYEKLCRDAVIKNTSALLHVNYNEISKEVYEEICVKAIKQNKCVLIFVECDELRKELSKIK